MKTSWAFKFTTLIVLACAITTAWSSHKSMIARAKVAHARSEQFLRLNAVKATEAGRHAAQLKSFAIASNRNEAADRQAAFAQLALAEASGQRESVTVDGLHYATTGVTGCALECLMLRRIADQASMALELSTVALDHQLSALAHAEEQRNAAMARYDTSLSQLSLEQESSTLLLHEEMMLAVATALAVLLLGVGSSGLSLATLMLPNRSRRRYREEWSAEFADLDGLRERILYGPQVIKGSVLMRLDEFAAHFNND